MTQLSDNCFTYAGRLMAVAEVLEYIERNVRPVVITENLPLCAAVGRVLARDVVATMNLPSQSNSAVDGYAVTHSDLNPDRETILSVGPCGGRRLP